MNIYFILWVINFITQAVLNLAIGRFFEILELCPFDMPQFFFLCVNFLYFRYHKMFKLILCFP